MDSYTEAPRYTVYRRADVTEQVNEELLVQYDLSSCQPRVSLDGIWGLVTGVMTHPAVETHHKTQAEAEAMVQGPEWTEAENTP